MTKKQITKSILDNSDIDFIFLTECLDAFEKEIRAETLLAIQHKLDELITEE